MIMTAKKVEEHANKAIEYFGFNIFERTRLRKYVTPRQFFWRYMRQHTTYSLSELGRPIEGICYDHSTVIHAINSLIDVCKFDKHTQEDYYRFCKYMKHGSNETVVEYVNSLIKSNHEAYTLPQHIVTDLNNLIIKQ